RLFAFEAAADGRGDEARDDVRIHVGAGTAILDVPLLLLRHLPRDAHRRAAIRHALTELLVRAGLVLAGEALLDAVAVVGDVERVRLAERFGGAHARVERFAHLLGREVGVRARAVPIALDRFGRQRRRRAMVLGDAIEQPTRDPQMIAGVERGGGTDLGLPRRRPDLGLGAGAFWGR